MTNEFKVGDQVICVKDCGDNITKNKIYTIYDINNYVIKIHDDKGYFYFYDPTRFQLVERKIGDVWFKPEELETTMTHTDDVFFKLKISQEELNKLNECSNLLSIGYKLDKNKFDDSTYKVKNFYDNENDIKQVKSIRYIDRCKSPHAGSSTCKGCDSDFWLDDDPYKKVEEFKVDKLGWYESTCKSKFECVKIHNNFSYFIIYNLSKDPVQLSKFNLNGTLYNDFNEELIVLTKYLGPELPKEPRKYEFEIYISKNILEDKLDNLKYIHLNPDGLNEPVKFKLILEEIIE